MRAVRLQDALKRLTAAIRDVECELAAMKAEHDPLAAHIFVSRRHYQNIIHSDELLSAFLELEATLL
jgi:hypothetical protein